MSEKSSSPGRVQQHPRYEYHLDVFLSNGSFLGRTANISYGGIFVPCGKHLALETDQTYDVIIKGQDEELPVIHGRAQVRWMRDFSSVGGHGLQIDPTDPELMKELIIKVEELTEIKKERDQMWENFRKKAV